MKIESARDFWRRCFGLVCNGSASTPMMNPALEFTAKAKAGEYDDISDDEYNLLLNDCEQFASLWKGKSQRTAGSLFMDALQSTRISRAFRDNMIELLSKCSLSTNYLPAQPASNTAPSPQMPGTPKSEPDFELLNELEDWSPRSIYTYLCRRIQGQDEAKKAAAITTYNQVEGRRSTSVFCGPSGCGKSEIWRQLAKEYPKLIRIVDASRLCAEGWKGSFHVRDIFEGIPESDINSHGLIVVLDEADKLCCETAVGSGGTNYNALTQNSLLKMLDGDIIEFSVEDGKPAFKVDCSRVSVVLLGAFEQLLQNKSKDTGGIGFGADARMKYNYTNTEITYNDLIDAGMRREIAGRINRIVLLHPLTVSDYRQILTGPILDDLQAAGNYKIEIDCHSADLLSEQASKTELGARWMRSQILNALDELMFEDPSANTYTVNYTAHRLNLQCNPTADR